MLGERLVALRKSRKWTQEIVASKLGVARGTYAHWEINKREPDNDTLTRLADLFEVSIDYLIRGKENSLQSPEWKELKGLINGSQKTRKKLASFLNIDEQTIQEFETCVREPNREQYKLIADFFGVSTDYLMGRESFTGHGEDAAGQA